MTEPVLIPKTRIWRRLWLSLGGQARNKYLLEHLAGLNGDLWSPLQITGALALPAASLDFLAALGRRPDGWQEAKFSLDPSAFDLEQLATLGLVRLAFPSRKISLTEAGRLLLTLVIISPDRKSKSS